MKKILALVVVTLLTVTTPLALACGNRPVAINDGGSSTSGNTTNQVGVVNLSAEVSGSGNAVEIHQEVNTGGRNYYYYSIAQTPAPVEEVTENIDWDAFQQVTTVYATAYLTELKVNLSQEGWHLLYFHSPEWERTHNYIVNATFYNENDGTFLGDYWLQYYTADGINYRVALTTEWHSGWRLAAYPASELVLNCSTENEFTHSVLSWLFLARLSFEMDQDISVHVDSGCGCCDNCACAGACHPGCGCGCILDESDL